MARKWKWGVLFSGDNLTLAETIDFAARAEDAGAESLWTTELGRDASCPSPAWRPVASAPASAPASLSSPARRR